MWYNIGPVLGSKLERLAKSPPRINRYQGCRAPENDPRSLRVDTWDRFLAALVRRFGSLARAWRTSFDVDERGKIDFREFCRACRELGYRGDIRTSWCKLNGGSNSITLTHIDEFSAKVLVKFYRQVLQDYSSIQLCWGQAFNAASNSTVSEFHFWKVMVGELGWQDTQEIRALFHALDQKWNGAITLSDLTFLEKWEEILEADEFRQQVCGSRFINRDPCYGSKDKPRSGLPELCSPRPERARASDTGPCPAGIRRRLDKEWVKLKEFLTKKYGSLTAAFFKMDKSGTGNVTLSMFQNCVSNQNYYCSRNKARDIFHEQVGVNGVLTKDKLEISEADWMAYFFQVNCKKTIAASKEHRPLPHQRGGEVEFMPYLGSKFRDQAPITEMETTAEDSTESSTTDMPEGEVSTPLQTARVPVRPQSAARTRPTSAMASKTSRPASAARVRPGSAVPTKPEKPVVPTLVGVLSTQRNVNRVNLRPLDMLPVQSARSTMQRSSLLQSSSSNRPHTARAAPLYKSPRPNDLLNYNQASPRLRRPAAFALRPGSALDRRLNSIPDKPKD